MSLKALNSAVAPCDTQLNKFLSQDRSTDGITTKKLGPSRATEFVILRYIGSGEEGLVLQCRIPQNNTLIALKLFFEGQHPSTEYRIWPLKNEALYYGSCAYYKARFSEPSVRLPSLPVLPYEEWAQVDENKLFDTIDTDIYDARQEVMERDKILSILAGMCANGWVAFDMDIRYKLWRILPAGERPPVHRFTGDVIVGIVKPFFEKTNWSIEELERQMQTMVLMRSLGWRLREFESRNWVNGYLVDGADVEVRPFYRRHLERSWISAFFCSIKGARVQAGSKVGDGRQVRRGEGNAEGAF